MHTPPSRSRHAHSLGPGAFLAGMRARPRLVGSVLLGVVIYGAIRATSQLHNATAALLAWNAASLIYLFLAMQMVRGTSPDAARSRALQQDDGRLAILALVVTGSLAVLLAVGSQLAQAKDLKGGIRDAHLALAALTVLTSWLFTQVLFALHYAHDFYSERLRGAADPLLFPGTADPGYGDFLYFSCVIGAAAQTADVSFQGSALRAVGTVHCIVSFFFNATLLALSINLTAGLLM